MKSKLLLSVIGIGLVAFSAAASTVTYVQNVGTPYQVPAFTTSATYGDMMAGMDVWVTFSDNSVRHATWAATGSGAGAATLPGFFSIAESGDTWTSSWTLQNLSTGLAITSFRLFGAGDDTTFDRTLPSMGTPGSGSGGDFTLSGNYVVTATYSDILNLTGSPAVGDEFVSLQVDFDARTLFPAGTSATFTQDTDSAAVHGSITPVPDAGSTGMLLSLGFLALAALKRRIA
jgi:hypothetical protein